MENIKHQSNKDISVTPASLKFNFFASKVKLMNYLILEVILFYIMIFYTQKKRDNLNSYSVDYSYLSEASVTLAN